MVVDPTSRTVWRQAWAELDDPTRAWLEEAVADGIGVADPRQAAIAAALALRRHRELVIASLAFPTAVVAAVVVGLALARATLTGAALTAAVAAVGAVGGGWLWPTLAVVGTVLTWSAGRGRRRRLRVALARNLEVARGADRVGGAGPAVWERW